MRSLGLLCALICLLALVPACSTARRSPDEAVLWTGFENEFPTLLQLGQEFTRQTGKKVRLVKVPFNSLRDKYLIAAPAGQGPDLLIGPQDWVGILRTAGMIEPLPAGIVARPDEFMPVTIEAMTFQGQLFAVPLVAECVALIRNPRLVPTTPHTMDELVSLAHQAQVGDHYGFYFELKEPYFSWPFLGTYGAYMFGKTPDGQTNPEDLGLANPGAIRGAQFLRRLTSEGLIPPDASNDVARSLYLGGRAGMILNGPWFLQELRNSRAEYVIEPIPGAEGKPAPCLVTVQGVMLNNRAVARDSAVEFMRFLARPEVQERIALASGRVPANREALERAGKNPVVGPDLLSFAAVVQSGVSMPNHPAVSPVWDELKRALEITSKGEQPADQGLHQAQERIAKRIRQMME